MNRTAWAIWITLAAAIISPALRAQAPDPKRDQIAAATARAIDRLRAQIVIEPVARNLTVADILKATGSSNELTKTLQRAQMIGGPRWLDEQTCQVRLEISGQRVANALVQMVNRYRKESPIDPEVLAQRLKDWNNRTFAATSTSTGAAAVEQFRPSDESTAWTPINDDTRQQAIAAAKRNAAGHVTRAVSPVALADGKTVGDALADEKVRSAVDQWLAARPVTQVEFRDDLQVAVTLATPPAELADAVIDATKLPEAERARVRQEVANRVGAVTRGSARAGLVNLGGDAAPISNLAPPWVNDQLDADGSGTHATSRLLAARAAEADAHAQLKAKVDALPLNDKQTLADAAKRDPRIAAAVARTVERARPSKVDYQPDGSAKVRVSLQLHDLWDAVALGL